MVNRHRRTSTAQVLKGGAGRSLPPLPIIDRASICPCPVGKADPALAHVPLVKALRYLAYPCCLRSRLHMEVFGLSPTFHASVPLLVSSSEWPACSLGPPSREPPPSCRGSARACAGTPGLPGLGCPLWCLVALQLAPCCSQRPRLTLATKRPLPRSRCAATIACARPSCAAPGFFLAGNAAPL